MENNTASDVVFVDSLHVSANIGPDCWDRNRAQPIDLGVYLLLKESFLDRAGASDNILDSIDYSTLTKKISNFIKAKSESETPFSGSDELIKAVSERAFDLAGEAAAGVRVTMGAPKLILLAAGFSVDIITVLNDQSKSVVIASKRVLIKDLVLPVIIGVNPAERKSKQRVKVNLIFHEKTSSSSSASSTVVNYQQVVAQLCRASLVFRLFLTFV
jgi:dihydroneopterin aldolase